MSLNKIQGIEYWKERPLTDEKRDWDYKKTTWVEDYLYSVDHPHRNLIIDELWKFWPFQSLLEVGCNCGPNLLKIKSKFSDVRLYGVDINKDAIKCVKKVFNGEGEFKIASASRLPFPSKSIDVILTDAVLMYIPPEEIKEVLNEFLRVAKRGLILVEWAARDSELGVIKDYHWCRSYSKLLRKLDIKNVSTIKIHKNLWPTKTWSKRGRVTICQIQ